MCVCVCGARARAVCALRGMRDPRPYMRRSHAHDAQKHGQGVLVSIGPGWSVVNAWWACLLVSHARDAEHIAGLVSLKLACVPGGSGRVDHLLAH